MNKDNKIELPTFISDFKVQRYHCLTHGPVESVMTINTDLIEKYYCVKCIGDLLDKNIGSILKEEDKEG